MTNDHVINIILNIITPCRYQVMAHYKDLGFKLIKWKEKLLHITTEFHKKEQYTKSKGQGKKHRLEERVQLKVGEAWSWKKNRQFVEKEVWD